MNEPDRNVLDNGEDMNGGATSVHGRLSAASFKDRVGELEMENGRLHRLVAELLIKNQQLRRID